ncbi:oligosaccharide repeat unit polymerase [Vibrio gangliei]|uniref:oligosaccharide repeat unit polymerase n=1 Tax=Vibrio gangliei TaxID=2077090 RepID=UPI000D020039|nr:oligosaccharide repeat unit polymerase [Vibrio gangliei]
MNFLGLDSPNKKIVFFVFIFCNIFLGFIFFNRLTLGGELSEYIVNEPFLLLLSVSLVVFSFLFVSSLHRICFRIHIPKINIGSVNYKSNVLDIIALLFLIISFLFSIVYGYGRIGFDSESSPFFVLYFNKFLVPILVVEIYLFYNFSSKNKIYYLNVAIFLALSIYKGFTGPILHIGFLFIYRLYFNGKLNIKTLLVIFFLAILMSPIIRILKNIIIRGLLSSGDLDFFDSLNLLYTISNVNNFFDLYFIYFERVIERFESVSITYYIIENSKLINDLYNAHQFLPFYLYHWIPQTIEKIFSQYPIFDITQDYVQREIAYQISPHFQWQTHIGYFAWMFITPLLCVFYFFYTLILVFLSTQLTKVLSHNNSATEQLSWYFTISYIVHGWFNQYILYIQALMVFLMIIIFASFIIKPFRRSSIR